MSQLETTYQNLTEYFRQTALLRTTSALLEWDEQTLLPGDGGEYRAEQVTLLAGMIHQRDTDARVGEWLGELASSPLAKDTTSDTGATILHLKDQYDKQVKLPQKLVEELSRTSILSQQAWGQARRNDDFASFQPWLEKMFELKRQEAQALGYTDSIYDPLLDQYEPKAKTSEVVEVFRRLREDLVPLVAAIHDSGRQADLSIMSRDYDPRQQEALGRRVAADIGFNFQRGRLDVSAHPFCSTEGPNDIRMTTRYQPNYLPDSFFGILHESGHGLYEQGLPNEHFGLPLGEALSLGIHESQSRLWENLVGRSRPFWERYFPVVQQAFPGALAEVALDDFYAAVNAVRPSLIRTESDEATYNLHILVRFELEQALLGGDLPVADLPTVWREKYRDYVGIEPPSDANGVLQDIHWSAGLIGYFPTYTLGNLYASQFFAAARQELGDMDDQFRRGEFAPLLNWLRERIHRHGRRYPATELVQHVTGQPLSHAALLEHLRTKLEPLYGLS